MKIELRLTDKTVDIQIKKGLFKEVNTWLAKVYQGRRVFVLTDENVDAYYGQALMDQLSAGSYLAHKMVLPAGEKTKSLASLKKIYDQLIDQQMTRKDLIIILGGGVMGDLGGFAAASYLRGISYVQIPTSLLAQVDSSIGGKVGINLEQGKNLAGAFYHPLAVWIDPDLLKTLDPEEFRGGMAEVIKYGCIDDAPLLSLIHDYYDLADQGSDKVTDQGTQQGTPQGTDQEADQETDQEADTESRRQKILLEMISRSVAQKVEVVGQDEREAGRRKILNFGHTLGHAIEKNMGYGQLSHGQAVAIGMAHFTRMSEKMKISSPSTSQALMDLLDKVGLPKEIPSSLEKKALIDAISRDKKMSQSTLSIVLLKRLGHGFIKDIDRSDVEAYI